MTTAAELAELSEADYVDRIIDTAHTYGWRAAHFRPARTRQGWRTALQGDKGVPDLILARSGYLLLVEVKTNTGRVRPEQRLWLDELATHARVWRPRDWPYALPILRNPEEHL